MRSCRAASVAATALLLGAGSIGACREAARPEVPPVTVATPTAPLPGASAPAAPVAPAAADAGAKAASSRGAPEVPVKASFVDLPARVEQAPPEAAAPCARVLVALVSGSMTVAADTLAPGDVLVLDDPSVTALGGSGVALVARRSYPCAARAPRPPKRTVVRASAAKDLAWAGGAMHARLDVGRDVSPELYMGRLSGTGAVAEHTHPGTWEILAAVDAAGTFTLGGVEHRLGARQIVVVPPDAKHAWRPDPGSKLVAIQMYDPPGPEQRFVALAAAAKDAGADASR